MELSDGAALGGVGVAKEVLQNSTPICTTAPWSWQLQGVLELGCLAGIFAGVAGVLEWSHAKQALSVGIDISGVRLSIGVCHRT